MLHLDCQSLILSSVVACSVSVYCRLSKVPQTKVPLQCLLHLRTKFASVVTNWSNTVNRVRFQKFHGHVLKKEQINTKSLH